MKRRARPCSVTFLSLGVLIVAGFNLIRFIVALDERQFLAELPGVSPGYIALSGLFWSMGGFLLAWGIWRAWKGIYRWTVIASLGYSVYTWIDRILVGQSSLLNWKFLITLNLAWFLAVIIIFERPNGKAFFRVKNER